MTADQQQARKVRRRRIHTAMTLSVALAVAVVLAANAILALADNNVGQAILYGALTAVSGVWVAEEYRALRRALRPGVVNIPRRRP